MPRIGFQLIMYAILAAPAAGQAASAQFSAAQIVIPGKHNIAVTAVNAAGKMVGTYTDRRGGGAFVLSGAAVTPLPPVQSGCGGYGAPLPTTINASGDVAGYTLGTCNDAQSFLWHNGAYVASASQYVSDPGEIPQSLKLNDSGTEIFDYMLETGQSVPYYGRAGAAAPIPLPTGSVVRGLNNHGVAAGLWNTANSLFVLRPSGKLDQLPLPVGARGFVDGGYMNDAGEIAGTYQTSRETQRGFIYYDGAYRKFFPRDNTLSIRVAGLNRHGRVVGTYFDAASGQDIGFLYNGKDIAPLTIFDSRQTVVGILISDSGLLVVSLYGPTGYSAYRVTCAGQGC